MILSSGRFADRSTSSCGELSLVGRFAGRRLEQLKMENGN